MLVYTHIKKHNCYRYLSDAEQITKESSKESASTTLETTKTKAIDGIKRKSLIIDLHLF